MFAGRFECHLFWCFRDHFHFHLKTTIFSDISLSFRFLSVPKINYATFDCWVHFNLGNQKQTKRDRKITARKRARKIKEKTFCQNDCSNNNNTTDYSANLTRNSFNRIHTINSNSYRCRTDENSRIHRGKHETKSLCKWLLTFTSTDRQSADRNNKCVNHFAYLFVTIEIDHWINSKWISITLLINPLGVQRFRLSHCFAFDWCMCVCVCVRCACSLTDNSTVRSDTEKH